MRNIRPWQLFEHLDGNRDVVYRIPAHRGVDSMTIMSLETMLLVAASRMIDADTILELGTGMGYNAFNLARNTSADIETVDLERKPAVFERTEVSPRIDRITADIADVKPGPTDLVFCDINFTPETTARCTEIALGCSPKVICWHDYGHPNHPHVKEQLDALDLDLIHVEDTWMVFWFRNGL